MDSWKTERIDFSFVKHKAKDPGNRVWPYPGRDYKNIEHFNDEDWEIVFKATVKSEMDNYKEFYADSSEEIKEMVEFLPSVIGIIEFDDSEEEKTEILENNGDNPTKKEGIVVKYPNPFVGDLKLDK